VIKCEDISLSHSMNSSMAVGLVILCFALHTAAAPAMAVETTL